MPPHSLPALFSSAPVLMDYLHKRDFGDTSHNAAARLAQDGQRPQFKRTLLKLRLQTSANR
jgi:hypothetical protein